MPAPSIRGRRSAACLTFLSPLLALLLAGTAAPAQEPRLLPVLGGPPGSAQYEVAQAIAAAVSKPPGDWPCDRGGGCGVPGLLAVVQSSGTSVEALQRVAAGTAASAVVQADVVQMALASPGLLGLRTPLREVAVLAHVGSRPVWIAVRADSEVVSIAGLAGRRVSWGSTYSDSWLAGRQVFRRHGVAAADLDLRPMDTRDALAAVAAGTLDAVVDTRLLPSAVDDLRRRGLRLLPVDPAAVERLGREQGAFGLAWLAGPGGDDAAVPVAAVEMLWVGGAGVDRDTGRRLLEALWDRRNCARLASSVRRSPLVEVAGSAGVLGLPSHPGAEAFRQEAPARGAAAADPVSACLREELARQLR
ncbi:TAXI family TRAP transporter solute-binding subunit [Azospirillum sp. ST 5-10]|uniref:TAXI family TRAP transporter solute-binding subunit n=1 Tax=unclassified Azospirillum TaxID=2630922 RepID=UPI003F49F684